MLTASVTITDKHFQDWEQAVWGYGYGTGEAFVLPALHAFLVPLAEGYHADEMVEVLGGPVTWLLINVLCHADILEYGTSPRHGWLTPKGQRLREYVLRHTPDELYTIVTRHEANALPRCSPTMCNCADALEGEGCRHNPLWCDV
jgi:hypothetical protein